MSWTIYANRRRVQRLPNEDWKYYQDDIDEREEEEEEEDGDEEEEYGDE